MPFNQSPNPELDKAKKLIKQLIPSLIAFGIATLLVR